MASLSQRLFALRRHPRTAPALRLGGWVLVGASALFLAAVAARHWDELARIALTGRQWAVLASLVLVYGAALFLLGLAWHALLLALDARPHSLAHSVRSHTTAQLAKYVPGNVFHLVGRHMLQRSRGESDDRRLALATLAETLLLVLAAAWVAALCLAIGGEGAIRRLAIAGGVALIAATALALWLAGRSGHARLIPALSALAAMLAFFAVMALVLMALGAMLGLGLSPALAGGGVAAWIAGFVTPGAPGGLGVREAVMVIAGGGGAGADKLLMLGVLLRIVTFGGDVVCALAGRAMPLSAETV
jgi:uncharacterized membrane protein YbhN (UPF0104 family)